ncbi:PAS domain S-box protein [Komarekiella sp. 'clone 1']|uniref:histidine kinase n=1 Tax=Komarekiella delphini-convector SJRDD-AB1 TaxID=2593771 RepID=A0AA40SU88_9NOST|nr:PAS domain-containing protein [Komarekiella delphini-convector]MBD6615085.1 PAS domain S-box protein [Komarekiella delphini-convector SJRDD-AB1]
MAQPLTILIIDDSPEDRQAYRRYLLQDREHSYTILEEESGEGALALCRQFQPDGILLDFLLPDLDGLEFMAELKQQTQGAMPVVIMLTGYGNEVVAVQAMKSGVQDYLVKGQTTAERLRSTIHSAIKNAQLRQELQRSEERFRTSVENMLDCFGIYSAIRNETAEIVDFQVDYVNAAACEFNRMSQEEQQSKSLCKILLNFRESGLFNECCQVVETGKPLAKESLTYTSFNSKQQLTKAVDIRITKMGDGFVASWRDVTEKKQAEQRLQESQRFIERIAETTPGILYVYDLLEARNIYLNGQVNKLLGYTPQQIQDMGAEFLINLMHPDDLARSPVIDTRFDTVKDGDILENEYRMRHANGEWRWFCSRDTVFTRNADGSPHQIIGTTFDITERKQVEEKLRLSNERFQLAAAAVNCLIYDWDIERNTVDRTEGLTRILGYSLEETQATHQWWREQTHPEDRELLGNYFRAMSANQNHYAVEYRTLHKDQQYRYVLDQGVIKRNAKGQPVRAVGSTTDISDRKHAEVALRQSEERYRYLSDAMPQLVWICNASGEYEHVNQRWCEFTGQPIKEALGFGWTKVLHPEDIQPAIQAWVESVRTGELYEHEMRYRRFDGIYRWHLARGLPIKDEQGRVMKWFGTSTDIDDRKQLEAERNLLLQLEQTARAEAEAANRTKDEFVAMVSHDLRSPLNAILGWAKILRTRQLDSDNMNRALETIESNAKSQAKLLEDLLDMSRIIRGKLQLEFSQVNLGAIIGVAIETVYPSANAKNISLESTLDRSIPAISADINRLLQVLGNILSNAIKFTPPGGRVEVRLSTCSKSTSPDSALSTPDGLNAPLSLTALIQVSDTGIGISPELLPHVFERYHQGHSTHKGGLGLGLAIARHLVELHGGTIQATSPGVGQGATFTVKLPLSAKNLTGV